MPLEQGTTKSAIASNIGKLNREGKPAKQSVAIAIAESKKKKGLL